MKLPYFNDTIAAIATPLGVGAIGIVRLSGPRSREVLERLWISPGITGDKLETHRFYYGKIGDNRPNQPLCGGEGEAEYSTTLSARGAASRGFASTRSKIKDFAEFDKQAPIIDEVMAVYFAGPRSYTGEDMVEIHCHGGTVVVQEVLAACVARGARLAEPGEFTRRAFLNGKMDLAQAEGVAAVIHATGEASRRNATDQLSGRLSSVIRRAMDQLTELRAFVEATIDFPEEGIEMIAHAGIQERLMPIRHRLSRLAETYAAGRLLQEGVRMVLVGAPNVGKSSLMNRLLGQERAIVHEAPGTTRDYVDVVWNLQGITVHLTDTAGLREDGGAVEQIGIEKSRQKMGEADIVVMVCDSSRMLTADEGKTLASLEAPRAVVVVNKNDLPPQTSPEAIRRQRSSIPAFSLSARTGEGVEVFSSRIFEKLQGHGPKEVEGVTISAPRHKQALDNALAALTAAGDCVSAGTSAEFIAHHLTAAAQSLGEIVGEVTTDELLGKIFGKFCIGK